MANIFFGMLGQGASFNTGRANERKAVSDGVQLARALAPLLLTGNTAKAFSAGQGQAATIAGDYVASGTQGEGPFVGDGLAKNTARKVTTQFVNNMKPGDVSSRDVTAATNIGVSAASQGFAAYTQSGGNVDAAINAFLESGADGAVRYVAGEKMGFTVT